MSMWRLHLATETAVLNAWRGLASIPCPFVLACIFTFILRLHSGNNTWMSSFPSPPLYPFSSPVAIIEPTTTSAVSSPGQYMSPCCPPDQQRGPLPRTNLSWNLFLHLDFFQLAGWNACWVYGFLVCPFISFICIPCFVSVYLGLASTAWLHMRPAAYVITTACLCFIKTQPPPPRGAPSRVIKVAVP